MKANKKIINHPSEKNNKNKNEEFDLPWLGCNQAF
jgi:hypothetical protein